MTKDSDRQLQMLFSILPCATAQVNTIHDALSLGQELQVKVMGHDARGNLQISHKALLKPHVDREDQGQSESGSRRRSTQSKL